MNLRGGLWYQHTSTNVHEHNWSFQNFKGCEYFRSPDTSVTKDPISPQYSPSDHSSGDSLNIRLLYGNHTSFSWNLTNDNRICWDIRMFKIQAGIVPWLGCYWKIHYLVSIILWCRAYCVWWVWRGYLFIPSLALTRFAEPDNYFLGPRAPPGSSQAGTPPLVRPLECKII